MSLPSDSSRSRLASLRHVRDGPWFGTVFRSFLLASVVLTALTKAEQTNEYSPWSSCRVHAQFTVLLPRSSPCQQHKRFHGCRLYLTLLLLLLAGDVELNPRFLQIRLRNESCDQISASPNRPKRAKSRDKTAGSLFTRAYTLVKFSQTKRCFFSFL